MRQILTPVRFVAMILTVLTFILTMSVVYLVARGHWARVRLSNIILTRFCRFSLWLLNVEVTYDGVDPNQSGAALIVANHHSYIDVLALHARVPACFVTSREIRETPGLGQICALAGCLFVERRKVSSLRGEVGQIVEGLQRGFNVAIFPEATSGNGEALKPFKRPLFGAAIGAKRPVLPICLNYTRVGQRPIDRVSRDKIFWYGDMDFAPHLWALCGSGGVDILVSVLNPILPASDVDAGTLAQRARDQIEAVFQPVRA